ncbi:MFS transporter [Bradyrhizobium sp. 1(2017)]|uniref:MFS transporter n=1 Tax=Bradyrhizobium sp. 1(2017) TaxID=1404888 RepID=UPI002FE63B26
MSATALREAAAPRRVAGLMPIMGVVFVAFLVIGVAMPVLPLHVHDGLGQGTFVVGLVAGSQFAASLISRPWAGHFSDRSGSKRGVIVGLLAAAASGLLYLTSLGVTNTPLASVSILLLGRGLLGAAESFIITAAVSWGLALADARSTGKVIAWVGSAMFAAFAIGAPAGSMLYAACGFAAVAIATAVAPLLTLLLVVRLPAVPPLHHPTRASFAEVLGAVWVPGLGSALGSVDSARLPHLSRCCSRTADGPMDGWPIPLTPPPSSWPGCSSAMWPTRSAARRSRWCVRQSKPPARR